MISQETIDEVATEKRKHVRITSFCNNKCVFCLAADINENFIHDASTLKDELSSGLKEGNTRLILSGGDPSINKNLAEIISHAKKMGYKKIQMITNGRVLSSKNIVEKLKNAGLDEVTFSIHSHIPKVHDELTQVKGSFMQSVKGVVNARKAGMIVNIDIVMNKKNVKSLKDTIRFFYSLGVNEFDLLYISPFGDAFKNKKSLFFDIEKNLKYLKEAFDYGKTKDLNLWTNRFPPEYLDGYEYLIQDTHKLFDEVYGRRRWFNSFINDSIHLPCKDDVRCKNCNMDSFCRKLEISKNAKNKKKNNQNNNSYISLTNKNIKSLEKNNIGKAVIKLALPESTVSEYKKIAPAPEQLKNFFNKIKNKTNRIKIMDIPKCISGESFQTIRNEWHLSDRLYNNGKTDLNLFTEEFIKNIKIKSYRCKKCIHYNDCEGIFQHYIKIYGFEVLQPITRRGRK